MTEIRETPIAIEARHLDVVRGARRAEFPAWRVNSSEMSGLKTQIDLGWLGAVEAHVGLVGVVTPALD